MYSLKVKRVGIEISSESPLLQGLVFAQNWEACKELEELGRKHSLKAQR